MSASKPPGDQPGLTYKQAGVDIEAGADLIRRIAPAAKATRRPELLGGLGGFAAMAELPSGYEQPILVTGTDGVGTKLKLAIDFARHDGVGQDLVAMCANDVLVTGAEAFLFLDYYATGKLDVDVAERVIKGIAKGCDLAGCALAGGETAEMPGFYSDGEYDLAGFCIGVVEKRKIIDGSQIQVGNKIIGLPSSGPHSNGYSLVRKVLERQGVVPNEDLLDDLLAPTRIYVKPVRELLSQINVNGMVHITGGGFYENIPRVFTASEHAACIDLDSWQRPEVFAWLQQAGNISEAEMLSTFNCGLGLLLIINEQDSATAVDLLRAQGEQPVVVGEIVRAGTPAQPGQLVIA
ncbi:MAG TPA: phosphoribosylformylglycinamidine cyclo-ligase [Gammaproteobacteria bacterium]|nr:phosphoribosylformylglycinamidine cyclo-ligase [Gammaproteobacteria bacterium]